VIPSPFDYVRAESTEHALAELARHGDDAKLLAGGHSLLPLMKLRLAAPSVLVDVGRCAELAFVRDDGDHVSIGALTRHREVETDALLGAEVPLLAHATHQVGDPQVRHRGTIGGSLAHGDPASDLPAVMLALGATFVIRSSRGERRVRAEDFFLGFLETVLEPDEMLAEIRVPKAASRGWSFQKFNRRAQDWAIVGVACVGPHDGDPARVGLVNMDNRPVRAHASEAALAGGADAAGAAAAAADGLEPPDDLNASSAYRRHLVQVLVRRALAEAGV
jgi:aerobic carbon-monoxide dehydrogenase medium subunit